MIGDWVRFQSKDFMSEKQLAATTEEERETWEYGKLLRVVPRRTKDFPGPHVEVRWESDYTKNWFLESVLLADGRTCEAPSEDDLRRYKDKRVANRRRRVRIEG
jgi:hypothetical protein